MISPEPIGNGSLSQKSKRRILIVVALLNVLVLLYLTRNALFPFVVSGIFAYLLFPIVKILESIIPWRNRWPGASRICALLVIYILAIIFVAGLFVIVVPPVSREATDFIDSLPTIFSDAQHTVEGWNKIYSDRIPEHIRLQIEEFSSSLWSFGVDIGKVIFVQTVSAVSNTFTLIIGLAMVPVLLFYFLKDHEMGMEKIFSMEKTFRPQI